MAQIPKLSNLFKRTNSNFSFKPQTRALPNMGGSYQSVVPSLRPSTPAYDPNQMQSKVYPGQMQSRVPGPTPSPSEYTPSGGENLFQGGGYGGGENESPDQEITPALDYSKYINPKTGAPMTPAEYAESIAEKSKNGIVPNYAGDSLSMGEQSADQLNRTATDLNNARNDIASGEKDPYGVASDSGLQYSPAELKAIESAYAGVFDPALKDVFSKLETKQKQDAAEAAQKQRFEEMAKQHEYDLERDAANNKAKEEKGEAPNSGDFAATIDLVGLMGKSVYEQKAIREQLRGLIDSGDYVSAYDQIKNSISGVLTGTEKQKFDQAGRQYLALDKMKNAIQEYAGNGGDMGLLTGTEEQIKRKLGIKADGQGKSEMATYLWQAFQDYRSDMSGAAFGAGESRDYASVNPTLGKSLDLNVAVIDGARKFLKGKVDSTVDNKLSSAKYIREYAEGAIKNDGSLSADEEAYLRNQKGYTDADINALRSQSLSNVGNTSGSKLGVIDGFDIKSYATDPNHEKAVTNIYNKTRSIASAPAIDAYIRSVAPGSPITGADVMAAAQAKGVPVRLILAIMQQDSTFGTKGKAVRTFNPGNVGNDDTGRLVNMGSWKNGVLAVANNLAKRRVA